MKKTRSVYAAVLALGLACLTGCGSPARPETVEVTLPDITVDAPADDSPVSAEEELQEGGTLWLKVNPEITIDYDDAGMVTAVTARNDDALKILAGYSGFEGKEARQVAAELVTAIGEAGYFVEEVEGGARQVTLEIESGSRLPDDAFLDEVVAEVRTALSDHNWTAPVSTKSPAGLGVTDYVDTDYGPGNDGVTDYHNTGSGAAAGGAADGGNAVSDPAGSGGNAVSDPNNGGAADGGNAVPGPADGGMTDYDDTDYGPNSDGVTDYDDTDYGPNSDGVTDYDDTDYGPNSDGVTDYGHTDYGNTDYSHSDYGHSSYHH